MYRGDANVSALITFAGGLEVTYQGTWAGNWQPMTFNWRTETPRGVVIQADMNAGRRDGGLGGEILQHGCSPWICDQLSAWGGMGWFAGATIS